MPRPSRGRAATALVVALTVTFAGVSTPAASAASFDPGRTSCGQARDEFAITFDDGGPADLVTRILDVAQQKNVRMCFFPIGRWAGANGSIVARMYADGHVVGNHTANHRDLARLGIDDIRHEVKGGVPGRYCRPPYGSVSAAVLQVYREVGCQLVLWSNDSRDWAGASSQQILDRALSPLDCAGGNVLLHMHQPNSVAVLPALIDQLRARGCKLPSLDRAVAGAWDATHEASLVLMDSGNVLPSRLDAYFGDAHPDGAARASALLPTSGGYLVTTSTGCVRARGTAEFRGDLCSVPLGAPIVAIVATPSGAGYWLVAADGGVFTYGDAGYFGSTGGVRLNAPVVGMAPTPTGDGYWLVGADGGIYTFGAAKFLGGLGGTPLGAPIAGIAGTASGEGYWLVGRDGGVFSFGDATFRGSYPLLPAADRARPRTFLGMARSGAGYVLLTDRQGEAYRF